MQLRPLRSSQNTSAVSLRDGTVDGRGTDGGETGVRPASDPLRVLAFVEACGVTGALRNLLDLAELSTATHAGITYELATYWRSPRSGQRGPSTDDIQACIEAARRSSVATHVLHERRAGDPRLLPQIRRLLDRVRPDIVETHHVKSHFLFAACRPRTRLPWVAFHHGYTTTSLRTRVCNLLDRWSLSGPSAIVTPCEAFAQELRRRGIDRSRIAVVHSSVPAAPSPGSPHEIRSGLGVRATDSLVLSVGRLSREKAHDQLLTAFARLPGAGFTTASLAIAGDGPERLPLMQLAGRLGLHGCVHFLGHQPNVWPYYRAADVIAMPSHSEGSPIALLEAMAAAKPIVATRVGGIPEIIEDHRTGILVPPRDPGALADALAHVLRKPVLAAELGARACQAVRVRFPVEARMAALLDIYRRVAHA